MSKAGIDLNGWIRCYKCGHKLMQIKGNKDTDSPWLEIKCHSCKAINTLKYSRRIIKHEDKKSNRP